MKIRSVKPTFFDSGEVVKCSPLARLLFIGLWCAADREGRLEDRPDTFKLNILPGDECDMECLLTQLADAGLIMRYEWEGRGCIQIPTFLKYQKPWRDEAQTVIKPPDGFVPMDRHDNPIYLPWPPPSSARAQRANGTSPKPAVAAAPAAAKKPRKPRAPKEPDAAPKAATSPQGRVYEAVLDELAKQGRPLDPELMPSGWTGKQVQIYALLLRDYPKLDEAAMIERVRGAVACMVKDRFWSQKMDAPGIRQFLPEWIRQGCPATERSNANGRADSNRKSPTASDWADEATYDPRADLRRIGGGAAAG